jgi:hypothetical protein
LLDVCCEVFTELEIELCLPAFLSWGACNVTVLAGIPENEVAELLIDQNPGLLLGYSGCDCSSESVIDYSLELGDLCRLLRCQGAGPSA